MTLKCPQNAMPSC